MKTKALFVIAMLLIGAVTCFSISMNGSKTKISDIQLANIEALSSVETGGSIPCFSSATRNYNRAYVDCGSCTRIEGWKGTGTEGVCRK